MRPTTTETRFTKRRGKKKPSGGNRGDARLLFSLNPRTHRPPCLPPPERRPLLRPPWPARRPRPRLPHCAAVPHQRSDTPWLPRLPGRRASLAPVHLPDHGGLPLHLPPPPPVPTSVAKEGPQARRRASSPPTAWSLQGARQPPPPDLPTRSLAGALHCLNLALDYTLENIMLSKV
jgi:hypothetical protein